MSAQPDAAGQERLLLVLEDDDLIGLLVGTVARLEGMTVHRYAEPAAFFAALDTLKRAPTHILMDMTLPGWTGDDVLRELAARGCGARIVIASGIDAERLEAAGALARELGLTLLGVLTKPFRTAALRALLA